MRRYNDLSGSSRVAGGPKNRGGRVSILPSGVIESGMDRQAGEGGTSE